MPDETKTFIDNVREMIDRREFLGQLLDMVLGVSIFVSGGFGAALIWKFLQEPERSMEGATELGWLQVGRMSEFNETPRKVYYGEEPVYVYYLRGKLVAFSAICPHVRCMILWNPTGKPNPRTGSNAFDCPCHVSSFDIEGRRLYGPAPRGLYPQRIKVAGNKVLLGGGTPES